MRAATVKAFGIELSFHRTHSATKAAARVAGDVRRSADVLNLKFSMHMCLLCTQRVELVPTSRRRRRCAVCSLSADASAVVADDFAYKISTCAYDNSRQIGRLAEAALELLLLLHGLANVCVWCEGSIIRNLCV